MTSQFAALKERAAKFHSMVDRRDPHECWHWSRTRDPRGYGRFYIGKSQIVRAHRVAWMLANDRPVPEGLLVCHSCDNPSCCNPAHLWIGTDADNNRDRASKGRTVTRPADAHVNWATGERHGSAKLTEKQVASIKAELAGGASLRSIAPRYGVDFSVIGRIKRGRLWSHIELLNAKAEAGEAG